MTSRPRRQCGALQPPVTVRQVVVLLVFVFVFVLIHLAGAAIYPVAETIGILGALQALLGGRTYVRAVPAWRRCTRCTVS